MLFVSDFLTRSGRAELANMLDDKLLDQFLETLPGTDEKRQWFVLFDARRGVLENVAATIARKENPTNFVRAKFNPKVHAFVARVETQRLEQSAAWEAHEAALFLCIIALKIAVQGDAPESYRIGVATDHIHWLGRLMRSDVAASVYVNGDDVPCGWRDDFEFGIQTVARARRELGDALDVPIGRIMNDPWVAPIFKEKLKASLAT